MIKLATLLSQLFSKRKLFSIASAQVSKGYARLSPDFSMDFVRLIYFVVFLMLEKMQKNFFGKSTFLTCVETIFRSTIFDKIFFSKLNFFVFKSFRISHWTLRGHSLVTPKVLFTYFALNQVIERHQRQKLSQT